MSAVAGGSVAAVLGLAYLGIGIALAWDLGRRGHGLGVTASALPCWPLLLGLVGRAPPPPVLLTPADPTEPRGPHAARIDACLRALAAGLREIVDLGGAPLIDEAQLRTLGEALDRADLRIARVDRLLAEAEAERAQICDPAVDAAVATLRSAREQAQRELEGVLAGLVQLRVQLGLFTLAGEAEPVRERLAELEARIVALAQLASVELAQVRS